MSIVIYWNSVSVLNKKHQKTENPGSIPDFQVFNPIIVNNVITRII